jgi:hypothetical protein
MDGSSKKKTVYLVGVISEDPATHQWRRDVTRKLGENFITDQPTATRFDKSLLKETEGDPKLTAKFYEEHESEILLPKSYQSVEKCDIILINFQIQCNGHVGHIMELAWGYVLHKTIIAIKGEGFESNHPIVRGIVHGWAKDVDEAVAIIKQFFTKR